MNTFAIVLEKDALLFLTRCIESGVFVSVDDVINTALLAMADRALAICGTENYLDS